MYDFVEVEIGKVFDVLPLINEAMPEFLKQRDVTWEPRHVYGSLFLGLAQVSIILDDDSPIGFVVHRWMIETHTNKRYLHIWLFYLFPDKRGNLDNIISPTINYLENKSKSGGGCFLEIQTSRDGWAKYLKGYMEPIGTTYRRET